MTRLLLIGLFCISVKVQSGEVQHAVVEFKDKYYTLDVAVVINGEKQAVYTIVTDYDQFYRLSSIFVETSVISSIDAKITRRRILTRTCIFFFCFDATIVDDVTEVDDQVIKTVFVPEQSDFTYGMTEWQVTDLGDSQTLIRFNSRFQPRFWVPPILGPLLIKRKVLSAAKHIIDTIEQIANSEAILE